MKYSLKKIKALIEEAKDEPLTGDAWLDERYAEDIPIIGHTNPYYILFFLIAEQYKPKCVVELGSWRATAAAHFAAANPETLVITIDIHKDDKVAQQKAIEAAAQYSNLYYVNAWTWDAVPAVLDIMKAWEVAGIEILFIDAWHKYEYVQREWELYMPLLSKNALVIADDVFDAPGATEGMVKFWNEIGPWDRFVNADMHPGIPMGFMSYTGAVS